MNSRDALAHVQLANPEDVQRIGRDHLYVAFTYSWAYTDPKYDMTGDPPLSIASREKAYWPCTR